MPGPFARRRRTSGWLAVLFVIGWVCLSPPGMAEESGRISLRVEGLPNDTSVHPSSIAEQRVIAAFQKKHPHVDIVPATGLSIETTNSQARTMMMIAAGIAPDVIRMNFRSSDTYIRQGMVAPLEANLRDDAQARRLISAVAPQVRPVIHKVGPDGKEHLYGLPTQVQVSGLYFNRDLFRAAGLPPRAPRDWGELAEFARRINALGAGRHGLVLPAGLTASFHLMNFVRAAGGDAVREEGKDEWRAIFNSPEALEAYLFYYRLVEIEKIAYRPVRSPTPEELRSIGMLFGSVGDTMHGSETIQVDSESWGFGAVPRGPRGDGGSEINAAILSIFSGIKDEARKRAAWDYIRFVTSEEADRIRVETLVEMGQAQLVNPVTLRKLGFHEHLVMSPPGLEEEFIEALKHGKPEPYGKNCNLIYYEMTQPLDQILLSGSIREAWSAGDWETVRREVQGILDRAVARTNERMIGRVDAGEMAFRRKVAAGVVACILAAFVAVGWFVARTFSRSAGMASRPVGAKSLTPWLCLLPAAGLALFWEYIPLARGTLIAFQDYQILLQTTFIGLDNFANVLFNTGFWNSILVTGYFAGLNLTFGFSAPIVLAYMLHLIPKQKMLYRTLYYLPAVISGTAVYFLWRTLFEPEGILNQMLRLAGFEATRAWTQDPYLAMLSCVIPGIWAAAGPGCLIYLAALKTIPEEQFEAAEIDGAGFFRKTLNVVFPGLKALIIINFVGAVAAAFQTSANILIMTGGGPNGATEVTSLLIFYEAFTRLQFGTATAMSWIVGSMLLGFTVIQLRRLSRMEFKTAK